MNELIRDYAADVEFPDVSGAEHLQMLNTRDTLAEMEARLSVEERERLHAADRRLSEQAAAFHQALAGFVDLVEYRLTHGISPSRWWWYLDVLSQVPTVTSPLSTVEK